MGKKESGESDRGVAEITGDDGEVDEEWHIPCGQHAECGIV